VVKGDWTRRFRLQIANNQATPTPSAGRLGKVNVTVAAVGGSGDSLFVVFDTAGATIDELLKSPPEGSAGF
jgi:hypothetical protein